MPDEAPVLELRGITKTFPGTVANDHIDFDMRRGEVHALLGENGAGKSTLVKIVAGVYQRDGGELLLHGRSVDFSSTAESKQAGIAVIYQEPVLFPDLSVTENIFMGRQPHRSLRRIDRRLRPRKSASISLARSTWRGARTRNKFGNSD